MKTRYTTRLLPFLTLVAAACSPPPSEDDAGDAAQAETSPQDTGRSDTGRQDSGTRDTGVSSDTGVGMDAGGDATMEMDASGDATMEMDASGDATMEMDAMSMPDSAPDSALDSAPDAAADAALDAPRDAAPDTAADVASDAPRDAAPDAAADAAADVVVPPICMMPTGTLNPAMMTQSVMGMLSTMPAGFSSLFSCATGTFGSNEAVYALNVTSRIGVQLSTDNAATTIDTGIAIRRVCTDRTSEVACDDDDGSGTKSFTRAVLEPGMYSVVVDGFGSASGPFRLDMTTFTPAPNATCATATNLPLASMTTGSTANGGTNTVPGVGVRSGSCSFDGTGGQVFYSVNIPANSRVSLTIARVGTQELVIRQYDSCTTTMCSGELRTSGATSSRTLNFSNTTAMPRTAIFAIASTSQTADANFTISPSVMSLPANASCATPTVIAPGGMAMIDTAAGGSTPIGCNTTEGDVRYYSVTIPAGSEATATLTRDNGGGVPQNLRMRVLDNCMADRCLASVATSSATGVTASLANPTAMPRTFLIAVGSTSTSANNTGTLAISTTSPLFYTESRTPTMCDNLSMGTPVPLSSADDAISARRPIGILFNFYGAPVGEFIASTNGWVQLLPMGGGTAATDSVYMNVAIPSSSQPNSMIAAFWDDLVLPDTMSLRTAIFGSAPNRRFVMEWNNARTFSGAMSDTLRFQVKLFETSNIIELHYCAIANPMSADSTGGSATIGVESPTGTAGTQHSFNTPNSIDTMNAIRFTPSM